MYIFSKFYIFSTLFIMFFFKQSQISESKITCSVIQQAGQVGRTKAYNNVTVPNKLYLLKKKKEQKYTVTQEVQLLRAEWHLSVWSSRALQLNHLMTHILHTCAS